MNTNKKYRLMTQLGEWTCGVACVSSALGISYRDALTRLEKYKGAKIGSRPHGLEPYPIISVLRDAGLEVTEQSGHREWPLGTIAFLSEDWGKYKGGGHYLLKTPGAWMDPWFNFPDKPRRAAYRERLPHGTSVQVALVPCERLGSWFGSGPPLPHNSTSCISCDLA